jgi:hypothetical protein
MAHQYRRLDVRSALLVAGLAFLASLACQSDAQDDAEGATTEVDSLGADAAAAGGTAGMGSSSGNAAAAGATGATPPPANESPVAPGAIAAASMPPAAAPASTSNAATAPALTFEACTYSEGTYGRNCDSLYVSMKQVSPALCVQLTFDNCGEYGRDGLPVDVPMPWRMDSGTVGTNLDECELGVYYPSSSVALRASGSVTWNETTRLPSELVLDVTLATSTSATDASVDLTTTTPITPSVCPD